MSITVGFTVSNVISEARRIVQVPNQSSIPDATWLYYLNLFWQTELPQHFVHFALSSLYQFQTQRYVDKYAFPTSQWLNLRNGVFVDGYAIRLLDSPSVFTTNYALVRQNVPQTLGTGVNNDTYTITIESTPLVRGFTSELGNLDSGVFITAVDDDGVQLSLQDNGLGVLEGDGYGTVDYVTGAVSATFTGTIPTTSYVYSNSQTYSLGRPVGALFFQNTLTLRPIPDKPYTVSMQAYQIPVAFTAVTDAFPLPVFFEYAAWGIAAKISKTLKDVAQTQFIETELDRIRTNVQNITYRQDTNLRPATQFFNPYGSSSVGVWIANPAPTT